MATRKHIAPTAAQSVRSLPDHDTLLDRLGKIQMEVYRIKSIAGAAILSVRELQQGEGSEADGCLQVAHRLLDNVANQLDCIVLLAPAEAQEVANG